MNEMKPLHSQYIPQDITKKDGFYEHTIIKPEKETGTGDQVSLSGATDVKSGSSSSGPGTAAASEMHLKGKTSPPPEQGSNSVDLRIIHLNDIHGNIEPQVEKSITPQGQVGGLSYMGSVVKAIKMDDPESLLINAGDIVQGSFESEVSHGKPIMEVMNYLNFDAVELGNHDFANGRNSLKELINGIDAPLLGANIIDINTSKPIEGVESSVIRELKGLKIGIIGVDTPKTVEYVQPEKIEGMTFRKPEDIVRKQVQELKDKGVNLIIVTSHLGLKEDKELAQNVPGIDIIVGGHTHSALPEGEKVNDTIIVQAGCNNQYVGDLKLKLDKTSGKVVDYSSRLIPILTEEITPDPDIEKIIAPYLEEGKKAGGEIVGQTSDEMVYSFKEVTPLGQHIADSIREVAGTKLALCSGKMLRSGLKKGDISRKALFNSYPNTEDVVSVKLRGKHIKEELESRFAEDSRAIILPSGFSFTVDKNKPSGDRIVSIIVDGEPMDMEKEYDIAVTDNQARYESFKSSHDLKTVCSLRDAWFNYVKTHSPLTNELDGRITTV